MADRARITQPLCQRCQHPRSFHGDSGPCRALGCTECESYVSPLSVRRDGPQPGQVWADNDPRRPGRTVRIDSVEGDVATVTILTTTAPHYTGSGVGAVKQIKVSRFRPTASGYRLVEG